MAISTVFDPSGRAWPSNSRELQRAFDAAAMVGNLAMYLVRNLGWIEVRPTSGNRSIHIRYRPETLSMKVVIDVAEMLIESDCNRFIVETVVINPGLQIVNDVDDVVAILVDRTSDNRRPRIFSEPLSPQRLHGNRRLNDLSRARNAWLRSGGDLAVAVESGFDLKGGTARQYLARMVGTRPFFQEISQGFTVLKGVADSARETPVENVPDGDYGAWVAGSLKQVHGNHLPRFDLVETSLSLPSQRPVRIRYERLLLPWRSRGETLISSTAAPRIVFSPHAA